MVSAILSFCFEEERERLFEKSFLHKHMAIAFRVKEKYKNKKFKYLFFDTGEELKDTYLYLNKLEGVLNQKIEHIKPKKSFDELLREHNNFLPSPQQRWCTKKMKIEPFLEEMKKYKDYKIITNMRIVSLTF